MSEARLAASLDGPDGAPVLVLANPIGTTRAIWAAQVPVLQRHFRLAGAEDPAAPPWQGARTALGITDSRLTVIRGTSHLAAYQTPGPVTAAILGHLVG